MKKQIQLLLFFLLAASTSSFAAITDVSDLVRGTYETKADSLEFCFIENFMNKSKGTFWSTPADIDHSSTYIYWQQAHAIDVIIYAYERHLKAGNTEKAAEYKTHIENWYKNHGNNYAGATWTNPFTDDMAWIGLAIFHIGEAMNNTKYYRTAKSVFTTIVGRKVTDDTGTWLPWNTNETFTRGYACTMAPACLLAAKLYQYYGDEAYLEYAKTFYDYMIDHVVFSDGRVEEPPLSYTQGTFAEACRVLYHITGESTYRTKASTFLNYAFTSTRCNHDGLLRHEGTSMDQSIFKAVLIPYAVNYVLDDDMLKVRRRSLIKALQNNADALWEHLDKTKYPAMYCPYYWGENFDYSTTASMGAMASGASLLENVCRMNTTIIDLLPIPGDVNDDKTVTMTDANIIANYFVNDGVSDAIVRMDNADVNKDGGVTMADANAVVNIYVNQ